MCGVGTAPYGGQRIVPLIWGHVDMGCDLSPLTPGKWATDQYNLIKKLAAGGGGQASMRKHQELWRKKPAAQPGDWA